MKSEKENVKGLLDKLEVFDQNDERISRQSSAPGQHHYDSYHQYCLSLIGFAVGFGSFWRFPYLVYKNGGGAFLIPYFLAMFLVGIPLLYLETSVGQMHQRSVPFIYSRINKGYKMIGGTFILVCFHLASYYNIILTYSYRFLFSVFNNPLPFAQQSILDNNYFANSILHRSDSINQFGSINPILFFLYVFSLYVCYLVIKNGVKTSGKIIMFTALMPYLFFVILGIRGLFLDGAGQGIKFLFIPDFRKLFQVQIWIDAVVQVFFQMTVACSGIINLSSLKPKRESFLIGIIIIPISLVVCGMLCSINIFAYLGHFCKQANISIQQLNLLGPQLSFNVFPKALAILPWPNLWVFCFFVAMVFLGIDSEFGYLQSLFCYLKDEAQGNSGKVRVLKWDLSVNRLKQLTIAGVMIFSPLLTSSAGIYYLGFLDNFVSSIPFSLGAVIQYYVFVYMFPFSELQKQSFKYTGQKAPKWIQSLIQGKIVMGILLGNLALACVNQFFSFFKYSFGLYVFGWALTAYPYILAYIYWVKNKQQKSRLTFEELKQRRLSYL